MTAMPRWSDWRASRRGPVSADKEKGWFFLGLMHSIASSAGGPAPQEHVDAVVGAIRRLKSHTGSSAKAIHNLLKSESNISLEDVKKATKHGATTGALEQRKQSFLVKGESYPDTTPKVEILETTGQGTGPGVKKGQDVKIK